MCILYGCLEIQPYHQLSRSITRNTRGLPLRYVTLALYFVLGYAREVVTNSYYS